MKLLIFLTLSLMSITSKSYSLNGYEQSSIPTSIGDITVHQKMVDGDKAPVLFLHGLFFDHQMWKKHAESIQNRSIVLIDMPMHGSSVNNIKQNWTLNDCASMLIELMDSLEIKRAHAIGHSWGSMTIFRAVLQHPERFKSTVLFNMPYEAYSKSEKRTIKMQHMGLLFKNFYIKQAAKSLFEPESLDENPQLLDYLKTSMKKLSNKEIKYADQAVRLNATDMTDQLKLINVKHKLIVGRDDYIAPAKDLKGSVLFDGGHTLPLEKFEESNQVILQMIND